MAVPFQKMAVPFSKMAVPFSKMAVPFTKMTVAVQKCSLAPSFSCVADPESVLAFFAAARIGSNESTADWHP